MSKVKVENRWLISFAELRALKSTSRADLWGHRDFPRCPRNADLETYHEYRMAEEIEAALKAKGHSGYLLRRDLYVEKRPISLAAREVLIYEPDTLEIRVFGTIDLPEVADA